MSFLGFRLDFGTIPSLLGRLDLSRQLGVLVNDGVVGSRCDILHNRLKSGARARPICAARARPRCGEAPTAGAGGYEQHSAGGMRGVVTAARRLCRAARRHAVPGGDRRRQGGRRSSRARAPRRMLGTHVTHTSL